MGQFQCLSAPNEHGHPRSLFQNWTSHMRNIQWTIYICQFLSEELSYVPVKSKLQHPPPPFRAYPGHLTSFLAPEGGNLITTHRGWGIWLLALMSCYKINHGGDVNQRKRLCICGRLVENQRPTTQAVFRIWRRLWLIYIYSM